MMLSGGFEWNEAELEPLSPLNSGLVSILAFDDNRMPCPIGTGFIISAFPEFAIVCTAAHNFKELLRIQQPYIWHHPSTLMEFLPGAKPIDLDRKRVRAIYQSGDRVEATVLGWAAWDESLDIAFFSILRQDRDELRPFISQFELDDALPTEGAEVVALGYKGMTIANQIRGKAGNESFHFERQLLMRGGRITSIHPDGLRLCKGPCVETTIPVFPGMSGGPVMQLASDGKPMRPFGLISSDPYDESFSKSDRSIKGSSIVSLISANIRTNVLGQMATTLRLNTAFWDLNKDELDYLHHDADIIPISS